MTGLEGAFVRVASTDPIVQGLLGGIVIALLNLIGAALVLVWRDPSQRIATLGTMAGVVVMLDLDIVLG